MTQDEFDSRLHESPHLRRRLSGLFQSLEQAAAVFMGAVSRQLDPAQLEADIVRLQSEAAADGSDPARDHVLNSIRARLRSIHKEQPGPSERAGG
ncbi:MAG: hypothetical protein EFKGCFLK_00309 [Rhodocyclaceae bacterium]|mgnify:CR=1 FL=1|nr:MAG: hypothetical protein F9K21_11125 [Rhodocyclaceae bacterium]MBE7423101.1 hypothetical protein [Zoogloeaceae bacterium]MBV6406761.1 hypothetical protein [Rhodocyclaceae bacterium]MCK6384575.1 hypothetical protein [Rhodocyclaceae bacterium]CAG0931075.1 hypothetical protein RHDC3_01749 [Rhodocyclaceae bacterium]